MAYELRDRKQKKIYVSSSSSDSDSDSCHSDPDYSRIRPRRQAQRNITTTCNQKPSTDVEMVEAGTASSIVRERRGRPPRKRVDGGEKQSGQLGGSSRRRRRAPYSLVKCARHANKAGQTQIKRTILSWLMDLKLIEEKAEVWYLDETRGKIMLRGMITRAGIICQCCKMEIRVWEFEVHAASNLKRPYANIFVVKRQVSLLQCQVEALARTRESRHCGFNRIEPKENAVDKYDDACMICADGGELICCDKCPSTFHIDCLGMESIPQDDWHCPYCVCKHCGLPGYPHDEIFPCSQCQKKYHWSCHIEEDLDLNSPVTPIISPPTKSFCGQSCKEIFEHLERTLGVRNELGGGFSWSLIRQTDLRSARPTSNFHQIVESNCKIAVVWGMMNECFDATIDRHTGVNVIESVIYNRGSNLTRINFQGFYTAILEKDDEIISAASLRIHGKKVAEMPFVTTHENYRNKGMWPKLLLAIESALSFLKVESLVIPSIDDLVTMWTEKCGFSKIRDSQMKELIFFNTLMFTKAVRLQKPLVKDGIELDAMQIGAVRNNNNQNGVDAKQNQPNHMEQNKMEVGGVQNNDNKMQNGTNMGRNLKKLPLFDLNLEPPEDGENQVPKE